MNNAHVLFMNNTPVHVHVGDKTAAYQRLDKLEKKYRRKSKQKKYWHIRSVPMSDDHVLCDGLFVDD